MRMVVVNPPSGETSHYHIVVIEWDAFFSLLVVDCIALQIEKDLAGCLEMCFEANIILS
jgi:hypothetical protein